MKKEPKGDSGYARSLIEASLDPFVAISLSGKITDANEASVTITGVERGKLIGTDFNQYFTEPEKARLAYEEAFEKGFVSDCHLTLRHSDTHLTEVSFNFSVYKDHEGILQGVFASARDITLNKWAQELKAANEELVFQMEEKEKRAAELVLANQELAFENEEKEKRAAELVLANHELAFENDEKEKRAAELVLANKELAFENKEKEKRAVELTEQKMLSDYSLSLIEASRDPLFSISPQGRILGVNEATISVTGFSREQLVGSDFVDYFTDPEKAREGYKLIFERGFVADYPLTITDGVLMDVLFNGAVYRDHSGNVIGAVAVARDITEQKKNESDLIEAKVFAELATILAEEAQLKAEVAVKSKQQFLSNMSHEIRTPMNAIIGFTKVILKTDLTARQREYLMAIKISGDALIVLIDDILDMAKVDAGKMVFEHIPFRLRTSLSAMAHLFDIKVQEKNITLLQQYDEGIPEVLEGDPVRLHQIMVNLLSNALKFTHQGEIVVSLKILAQDEQQVKIAFSVSDTGIGISPEKLGSIFENFQQASSDTARLYGGTGLGLAIVKQLVEQQQGTISVKSTPGKGSVFSFVLSFRKTAALVPKDIEILELDKDAKKIKVLVVEDIPLNQLLMKTLLDDFGFDREIAANGRLAIEKLKTGSFDIILMDLQMPEMNGFEATEYIRNTLHSRIPIIALTADVTTVDLEKCKAVGMNDYIAKPVDEKILYSKIVSLVKKPLTEMMAELPEAGKSRPARCTDLDYLMLRTKADPDLMAEMITAYLDQTPPLIMAMKKSMANEDWQGLHAAAHKMIPSFSIMGMNSEFELMAKKVQDYAIYQEAHHGISDILSQLEHICNQACEELNEELKNIRSNPA